MSPTNCAPSPAVSLEQPMQDCTREVSLASVDQSTKRQNYDLLLCQSLELMAWCLRVRLVVVPAIHPIGNRAVGRADTDELSEL
jgi:hypothetical protein